MIISFVTPQKYIMNLALLLVILSVGIMPITAYGESGDIGYKLLPEKILEYTDGTLQVFVESDGIMIPQKIVGLKASSTDNKVIKIAGMESENEYITNIQIQALQPGEANIALAAPGFKSQEIPIKVFDNNNFPTQISMKITPNEFPVDGPRHGFVGIELLTTSGQPTKAEQDTVIKFSTPNNDIIKLENDQMTIKKGEYFAINSFEILASGDPIIFVESAGMKKISKFFTIQEGLEPLIIQAYAYPSQFTSYSSPTAFLLIQLQDNSGIPLISDKDIEVSITTTNPDAEKNTSDDFKEIIFPSEKLIIEEGSYWAYTSFTTRPDLGDYTVDEFQEYTIDVSADDYYGSSTEITVIHERIGDNDRGDVKGGILLGEGPAVFADLPFLTTGEEELLGVVYLEAELDFVDKLNTFTIGPNGEIVQDKTLEVDTLPVGASSELKVDLGSSNIGTVNIIDPIFPEGTNAAVIFGNTGTVAPKNCEIQLFWADNDGTTFTSGEPFGPTEETLSLKVEPLINKVLAGKEFPLLAYLDEAEGGSGNSDSETCYSALSEDLDEGEELGRFGVTHFTEDTVLTFSADEYSEIEPVIIEQNQPFVVMSGKSHKVGITTFDIRGSNLASEFLLETHTTDPTSFGLSYADSTLPKTTTLATVQVLDSAGNPVYAKEDIEITLVSNNESVLNVPDSLIIPKDDYRTFFEMNALKEGDTEIAILSEDLPLAKYDLNVKGIKPKISMDISGSGLVNEVMIATVSVSYPGIGLSADGLKVDWDISGAEIMYAQPQTNENGQARVELISKTPSTTNIKAVINGIGISNAESVASYTFAHPEGYVEIVESDEKGVGGLILDNSQLIYFIAPGAAAGVFVFLKRTNRLEEISERLPLGGLGEKIDEIKERVSEMRDRD